MDAMVLGIDVSKDRLDVAVRPTGESFIFKRTAARIEDLVAQLRALSPKLVAIEATGGFEGVVAAGLAGAGLPVVVVNPAQVRAFAQALGKRAKTDPIDAAVIAHFAEATNAELSDPGVRLGYFDPLDRLRLIGSVEQMRPNVWPVLTQVPRRAGPAEGSAQHPRRRSRRSAAMGPARRRST
jgi:transposase